jgi:hypothetical protein
MTLSRQNRCHTPATAVAPAPGPAPVSGAGPLHSVAVAPLEIQTKATQPVAEQAAAALPTAAQVVAGQTPAVPTPRRDRAETSDKLNQIVDAIISWNTAQPDGDTQLRVSIPAIKGIAGAMGASYQAAIQEVMRQRNNELELHHRNLMLGSRHNAGVRRKDEILQQIARDYLALDNWQQVKYQG